MINKKYTDILTAAKQLFYEFGIKKLTITKVCVLANVSKMTFYKYFKNKQELAKTVINIVFDERHLAYQKIIKQNISGDEKIRKFVVSSIEFNKSINGVFFKDLFNNVGDEIIEFFQLKIKQEHDNIIEMILDSQQRGIIHKELNPALILALIDKLRELSFDDNIRKYYSDSNRLIRDINIIFLYGITVKNENFISS